MVNRAAEGPVADGTSVVSDRWGTIRRSGCTSGPTGPSMSRRRAPHAVPAFVKPKPEAVAMVTRRRISTQRSRAGSVRHRADASRRDRAARSPDPQLHRAGGRFGVAFVLARLRALDTAGPQTDQQPLSGCVGRDVLAGACVPNPDPAGAVPVRVRSRSSAGLRTRGRLWHPRRQHRPLRTGLGSGDRCKGRRFAARRMYVPGILSSQPSQACLPSHGTVPERRANVQKGARLRGDRPTVFGTVSRLGWPPERRGYALAWLVPPK